MNVRPFVAPAAALLITTACLGWQRQRISVAENHLSQLRNTATTPSSLNVVSATSENSTSQQPPEDWKSISRRVIANQGRMKFADHTALLRAIEGWSSDQFNAALDEIDEMDPSAKTHSLRTLLLPAFIRTDPQRALMRFADQMADPESNLADRLADALEGWAAKEPAAAVAWFDGKIASGILIPKSLDGRSLIRLGYETGLVRACLKSNFPLAQQRISLLSTDDREVVLNNAGVTEVDARGYAQLLRENLKPAEATQMLATKASYLSHKGYGAVDQFLSEISATSADREMVLKQVSSQKIGELENVDQVPVQQIDQLRQWASTQSAGSQDKLTGKALASLSKVPFPEIAASVVAYPKKRFG